jgi:hypothetical protein
MLQRFHFVRSGAPIFSAVQETAWKKNKFMVKSDGNEFYRIDKSVQSRAISGHRSSGNILIPASLSRVIIHRNAPGHLWAG